MDKKIEVNRYKETCELCLSRMAHIQILNDSQALNFLKKRRSKEPEISFLLFSLQTLGRSSHVTGDLLVLHHRIRAYSGLYLTCQKVATHCRHKGIMKSMASKQPFNKSIKVIYLTTKVKNENKPLASRREDFWRQHSVLSRISYHPGRINTLIIFFAFLFVS